MCVYWCHARGQQFAPRTHREELIFAMRLHAHHAYYYYAPALREGSADSA